MDRILYKEADGDITCRSRDFDKVFPTLYAYEELEMTPEEIEQTLLNFSSFLCEITGGRMSKTNYTVQAMVDEAYANFERGCDECSDRQVVYAKTMSRADLIRRMTDEDLTDLIYDLNMEGTYCTNKKECFEKLNTDQITDEMCKKCLLEWLRKPAEEPKLPSFFEDKQESGLLED